MGGGDGIEDEGLDAGEVRRRRERDEILGGVAHVRNHTTSPCDNRNYHMHFPMLRLSRPAPPFLSFFGPCGIDTLEIG